MSFASDAFYNSTVPATIRHHLLSQYFSLCQSLVFQTKLSIEVTREVRNEGVRCPYGIQVQLQTEGERIRPDDLF